MTSDREEETDAEVVRAVKTPMIAEDQDIDIDPFHRHRLQTKDGADHHDIVDIIETHVITIGGIDVDYSF